MMQTEISLAIADDHDMMRTALAKLLVSEFPGYKFIIHAADGEDLMKQLHKAEKLPDIILLDVSMPKMNGYETMKAIRKQWSKQKVLAVSMYNEEFAVIKMILNGANGYITKELGVRALHEAIRQIHATGKYFNDLSKDYLTADKKILKTLIPKITDKEMRFLPLCASDMSYEQIATILGLSVRTVEGYRDNLFKKLNVRNRVGLALFAIVCGLVPNKDICL